MYAPPYNRAPNKEQILSFIKENDFGTLVTSHENKLLATHLPFLFDDNANTLTLLSHMAKANQQWKHFSDELEVLAIFQGPHTYISPFNYERELNVPTWNYIAVHVYGTVSIMESDDDKLKLLHRLVNHYDPKYYEERFENLPEEFIKGKMSGIVAFKIKVTRMEERFKLSQDKTQTEKQNIINTLSSNPNPVAKDIGKVMKDMYNNDSSE